MIVSDRSWWSSYDSTLFLHVATPLVFSYCNDVYMCCGDDKARVGMITRTESVLKTMAHVFAACQNGRLCHLSGYLLFGQHRGGILVSFPTGVQGDLEVLV